MPNLIAGRELAAIANFTDAEQHAYILGQLFADQQARRTEAVQSQGLYAPPRCSECHDWMDWTNKGWRCHHPQRPPYRDG